MKSRLLYYRDAACGPGETEGVHAPLAGSPVRPSPTRVVRMRVRDNDHDTRTKRTPEGVCQKSSSASTRGSCSKACCRSPVGVVCVRLWAATQGSQPLREQAALHLRSFREPAMALGGASKDAAGNESAGAEAPCLQVGQANSCVASLQWRRSSVRVLWGDESNFPSDRSRERRRECPSTRTRNTRRRSVLYVANQERVSVWVSGLVPQLQHGDSRARLLPASAVESPTHSGSGLEPINGIGARREQPGSSKTHGGSGHEQIGGFAGRKG